MTRILLPLLTMALLVAPLPANADDAADVTELTKATLPTLVTRAAGTDPLPLRMVFRLGAKLVPSDILDPRVNANLTVAAAYFAQAGGLAEDEFRLDPAATPKTMWEMLSPTIVQSGRRVPKYDQAALIFPEYITSSELTVDGNKASGTVSFRAPDAYEGTVHFRASRAEDAWQIVEFSFPKSEAAVRLSDGRWRLVLGARHASPNPLRGTELRLPEVSLVRKAPAKNSLVISITKDGELRVTGRNRPLSLMELATHLRIQTRDPAMREVDGSSRLVAILDIDATMPCAAYLWIMQLCADPAVKIYRHGFGVRERGTGASGILPIQLPKDRGLAPEPALPEERPLIKVQGFRGREGTTNTLADLYHALMKIPARERQKAFFELSAPPPYGGSLPGAYFVGAVDVLLRAGARRLTFEGAPFPRGEELNSATAFAAKLRRMRDQKLAPSFRLNRKRIAHTPGLQVPPPSVQERKDARVELRMPAWPVPEPVIRDEELEEEIVERDVVAEEPVIKDEEVTDESFGETEGLKDAPFESGAHGQPPSLDRSGVAGKQTPASINAALRWLQAHQSPSGAWEAAGFGKWCDGKPVAPAEQADGSGKGGYDVGVTGLALCAFLGAGYTHRGKHPFKSAISKGLRYLKNVQDPEGCFGPRTHQGFIYNHAIASLAMVEAYGMTDSPLFKLPAQRALDFIAMSRNPYFAWRYGVKPGDNDTSVTSWMTMVLKSADLINASHRKRGRPAPLQVDRGAFDGVRNWLDKMTNPQTGRVGYLQRGQGSARPKELVDRFPNDNVYAMTAAGLFMRIMLGEDPRKSDVLLKSAALVRAHPPRWQPNTGYMDMYYWYQGSLAMFQMGGPYWRAWKQAILEQLEPRQRMDTNHCRYKGSWDPIGPWGTDGGRVYATALMVLTLEAAYRYERTFSAPR